MGGVLRNTFCPTKIYLCFFDHDCVEFFLSMSAIWDAIYSCHINFVLLIVVPPVLTTKPVNQTLRENSVVAFHCSAIGNPVPEVTWIKEGKTVDIGDTLSFTVNRNQSGKYWCSADNGFKTVANASAYLDVLCKYQRLSFVLSLVRQVELYTSTFCSRSSI